MTWVRRNRFLFVFIILICGTILAFAADARHDSRVAYENALEGCERGNALRRESNLRANTHSVQNKLLLDVADEVIRSLSEQKRYHEAASLSIRVSELNQTIAFRPVPLANCKITVEKL